LSLMIESQEDAPSTPTVLAAAMLRSAWEETNLMPETTSTTQDSCPQKENKKFALAVKRGKEKTRAKAGSIFGNNNNHSRNARSVRVAEEIRGGLIQVSQPKTLQEGVPPSIEQMGGHQTLEPLQICSACSDRIEQLPQTNSNLNDTYLLI